MCSQPSAKTSYFTPSVVKNWRAGCTDSNLQDNGALSGPEHGSKMADQDQLEMLLCFNQVIEDFVIAACKHLKLRADSDSGSKGNCSLKIEAGKEDRDEEEELASVDSIAAAASESEGN